ncbi:(2Fe-2S)-binding protein [Melittangium boletus]|uniref:(2Fe-2S)-binding protein n=1 Tax=Melittangium boletus TaxID=83453 RepID=UPI003DA1D016
MIVCLCHAVSDRIIRARIAEGARTVEKLGEVCGAGTGCGGCHDQMTQLIGEGRQANAMRPSCRESCALATSRVASVAL